VFSLNSSIIQRDAASRRGPVPTIDSMRRGWPGVAVGQFARRCHQRVAWAGLSARRSALKLTGAPPEKPGARQSRPRHSLISSLIHLRTPASIGVYRRSLSSQTDLRGRSCTVNRTTEKRKVGGSTPPLTTTYRSVPSALTSANTYLARSYPRSRRDRGCPFVTVVRHPLSHVDRTLCRALP